MKKRQAKKILDRYSRTWGGVAPSKMRAELPWRWSTFQTAHRICCHQGISKRGRLYKRAITAIDGILKRLPQ